MIEYNRYNRRRNKIFTNRKTLNKSVRKKKRLDSISLTYEQYLNIIISDISYCRICNLLKMNISKAFFRDLISNKIPEFSGWYAKAKSMYSIRKYI